MAEDRGSGGARGIHGFGSGIRHHFRRDLHDRIAHFAGEDHARVARAGLRGSGFALGVLLLAQVALGISNVVFGLPLAVAVAHNGGAALLLFVMVALLARTNREAR